MTLAPASIYSIQGKKEESLKCTREKIPEFFGLSRRRRIVTRRSSTLATLLVVVVVVKFYGSIEFCYCKLVEVSVVSCVFMLHVLVHTFTQRRFVATFNHQGETPTEWA